jgi:hypothetical protein
MVSVEHSSDRLAGLRSLSTGTVLALAAVALGLVQTGLAAVGAPVWARLVAACIIAVIAAVSELDKANQRRAEKTAAAQAAQAEADAAEAALVRSVRETLRVWPLPKVADADPHEAFQVARTDLHEGYAKEGPLPACVLRDCGRLAQGRLRERGNLLLIGAPASGVTRTAYQIALIGAPGALVLSPLPGAGLRRALGELDVLARVTPQAHLLLWLDRIDQFLPDGLSAQMLRECRKRSPGLRVIATIASNRYPQFAADSRELFDEFAGPVTVERRPTTAEAALAEQIPGIDCPPCNWVVSRQSRVVRRSGSSTVLRPDENGTQPRLDGFASVRSGVQGQRKCGGHRGFDQRKAAR